MTHRSADLSHDEAMELMSHLHYVIEEGATNPRPGRAGRSDLFYAHAAAAYSILWQAGSERPVEEMTEALNALADALIHNGKMAGHIPAHEMVTTARERGLLA